jgi:hypothetical protein
MVKFIIISTVCMLYLCVGFIVTFVKAYEHKQRGGKVTARTFVKGIPLWPLLITNTVKI